MYEAVRNLPTTDQPGLELERRRGLHPASEAAQVAPAHHLPRHRRQHYQKKRVEFVEDWVLETVDVGRRRRGTD